MKLRLSHALVLASILSLPVLMTGCETQHSEETHENLLGGTTHKESTTTENPITGQTSTEHSSVTTH